MGNWRTINMQGSVSPQDLSGLKQAVTINWNTLDGLSPLSELHSLCGLGFWVQPHIQAEGTLAERDFSVVDIARDMQRLGKIAPSLNLTVHVGDEYESPVCVATIHLEGSLLVIVAPEIEHVSSVSYQNMNTRIQESIWGPQKGARPLPVRKAEPAYHEPTRQFFDINNDTSRVVTLDSHDLTAWLERIECTLDHVLSDIERIQKQHTAEQDDGR